MMHIVECLATFVDIMLHMLPGLHMLPIFHMLPVLHMHSVLTCFLCILHGYTFGQTLSIRNETVNYAQKHPDFLNPNDSKVNFY